MCDATLSVSECPSCSFDTLESDAYYASLETPAQFFTAVRRVAGLTAEVVSVEFSDGGCSVESDRGTLAATARQAVLTGVYTMVLDRAISSVELKGGWEVSRSAAPAVDVRHRDGLVTFAQVAF